MYEKLFDEIKEFEYDFYNKDVDIVEGYSFNQYNIVKRIHLYYSGRFESKKADNVYFHNMSRDKVRNGIKNIDLDTKDLQIVAENPVRDWLKSWVAKEKAKRRFKEIKLGVTLNECTKSFCKYGHLVLKKNKKDKPFFSIVDLLNIVNDPRAKSLADSRIVVEDHYLIPSELQEMAKDWDVDEEVKEIIQSYENRDKTEVSGADIKFEFGNHGYINLKEAYALIPSSFVDEDKGSEQEYRRYKLFLILNENSTEKALGGYCLYQKEIEEKDWPYKEIKLDSIEGRWLGLGLVEELFDPQVRKNELVNLRYSALRYAAIALFQTQDQTILRNIMTDLQNGDVVSVNQLLTRVPTEMRDHAVFQMEEQDIADNSAKLTNSFEITSGQELPSGTPYALGALMDRNVNKYYEFIRESYGLFWKEVVMEWVMPPIMSEFDKAELLKVADIDLMPKIIKEFTKIRMWGVIKKFIMNFGRKPTREEYDMVVAAIASKFENEIALDIPEGYLKDFQYDMDLIVTGEKFDKRQMLITITSILQMVGQNPEVLNNPTTQRLFSTLLEISGLSVADIGQIPGGQMMAGQQTVGGIPVQAAESLAGSMGPQTLPAPAMPQM